MINDDAAATVSTAVRRALPVTASQLKGDVDNIVLKALRKEPNRRCETIVEFSEDVRKHLSGLPVSARPDTVAYRVGKFLRRNQAASFLAALVLTAVVAGATAALWQAARAEKERARAERRFRDVRRLANQVVFKYHDAIEKLGGSTAVRRLLVSDATRYLDGLAIESTNDHELQRELAEAYLKLGDVQGKTYAANIGDTAGAQRSYRKAVELLEQSLTASRAADNSAKSTLVKAYDALAALMQRTGDSGNAPPLLENALQMQQTLIADEPSNPEHRLQLAKIYVRLGDYSPNFEARLTKLQTALLIVEELLGADRGNPTFVFNQMLLHQRLGSTFVWLGEKAAANNAPDAARNYFENARAQHRLSIAAAQTLLRLEPEKRQHQRYLAVAQINLAEALAKNKDEQSQTLELMRQGLQIFEQLAGEYAQNRETKFDVSSAYETFAEIHLSFDAPAAAARKLEQAVRLNEDFFAFDPNNYEALVQLAKHHRRLAEIYAGLGNTANVSFHRRKLAESNRIIENFNRAK